MPTVDQRGLDAPFTMAEVWAAIIASPIEKAPGPDGFTGQFFRSCWPIIKDEIMAVFNKFHQLRGQNFSELNTAFITLLSKKNGASEISHFRPISLTHSIAKLISKVLSIRLASAIDGLISPAQTAFQKGKCIHDSYRYVQGCVRMLQRERRPALLFKLDIAKTFDTVSWEYILELMQQMGFPPRWRDWIAMLLSSASSSCMLNGTRGPRIYHARGLRQGDPLSPLLFILAIDPLYRLLAAATDRSLLAPLPGRGASMRISLYADDAVIFANPIKEEVDSLLNLLKSFGEATGLKLNQGKSFVAPISCDGLSLSDVLQEFGGQTIGFPVTYLGLPISTHRLRMVHFQFILDRIRARLAGWKGKLMNLAGRRVLVRCVLSALPHFRHGCA